MRDGEAAPDRATTLRRRPSSLPQQLVLHERVRQHRTEQLLARHLRLPAEGGAQRVQADEPGGDDAVPPGPLSVRVRIELTARNATGEQLRALVARAETRSPVRDAIARSVQIATEIVAA